MYYKLQSQVMEETARSILCHDVQSAVAPLPAASLLHGWSQSGLMIASHCTAKLDTPG